MKKYLLVEIDVYDLASGIKKVSRPDVDNLLTKFNSPTQTLIIDEELEVSRKIEDSYIRSDFSTYYKLILDLIVEKKMIVEEELKELLREVVKDF